MKVFTFLESSFEKKKPFPKLGKCNMKNKSLPQVGKTRIEKNRPFPSWENVILEKRVFPQTGKGYRF
ncbi:hypothetical protein DF185_09970 [Marinifilum breve]|uniref:Uncharacterized protein n=1 Tax=Marinifilum breve TaxID=2184082 RepID=A0A2V3ZZR0_9BACT|nr:hypothetical protein DF185_09970 [Marinifilum breve]